MKLLWIAPQPFYAARGTPMNVRRLAETICGLGHEIELVTYALGEEVALPSGMRVHRAANLRFVKSVPIGPSFVKLPLDGLLYRRASQIVRAIGADRIDLFHGFEEGAWIAAALGLRHRRPFVYDMDSDLAEQMRESPRWAFRLLAPIVGALDHVALRRAAAVVTVCETLTERARRLAPATPVFQIEDAPNVDEPADPSDARRRLRAQWNLPEGKWVVYTGNLEPYQGVDMLVRAAASVLGAHPTAVFLVVGGLPQQVEALRALAAAAPDPARIVFTGARPEAEMPLYLAAADVLVSPRALGCNAPLKLYSYLAAGKAIVVTDRRVHTQIVSPDEAALADPSPSGLAAAIGGLLADPARCVALGRRARALAETRYSLEAFRAKTRAFAAEIPGLARRTDEPTPFLRG